MAKQIIFGDESRAKMKAGIEKVANAVKVTLGPKGRSVVLEKKFGSPLIIDDGVTIAKDIELEDKFENMGAQLIREVAAKTNDVAGDGTTTATVLADALLREGIKNITAGANPTLVKKGIEELHINCFGPDHECNNLSGGNQQKVVFAKWIYTDPKILILDEPTRGVDIGAKKEIYTIINELAAKGVAIIMVSSELPEVLGMSDRIMVVREGEVRGIIGREEANQENIMTLATGGTI